MMKKLMILLNEVQFLSNAAIKRLVKWKSLNFHLEPKRKLRFSHLTNLSTQCSIVPFLFPLKTFSRSIEMEH